jgi:2-phosphosulfolactate phosphatase
MGDSSARSRPLTGSTVAIDCFVSSLWRYAAGWAVVTVDVIRSSTTAVTAAASGRRCFPVPSLEAAVGLASQLDRPLLVGELGGNKPYGFELTNSPAQLAARSDNGRPMILLSSSGTDLMHDAAGTGAAYVACLRNHRAQVEHLAGRHERVAVVGAGTRRQFREEDQLCCAWIAGSLIDAGYAPYDATTTELVDRWREKPTEAIVASDSVRYLLDTGQKEDLDFILEHVNDLDQVFALRDREVVTLPSPA